MEVTVAKFEYTKDSGETSDRKILVLSKPSDSFLGIEFEDDLEIAAYLDFMVEREHMEGLLKLKYGIANSDLKFRRFKDEKITSTIVEEKLEI